MTLHGVFLALYDKGVLLQGPSGCGKSECALALIDRYHQLICDDAPLFVNQENNIVGSCPKRLQNLLEVRGLGIIDVQSLFGPNAILASKKLDLILDLIPLSPNHPAERRIDINLTNKLVLDVSIPYLALPLIFKSNMAILIETAVRLAFAGASNSLKQLLHLEVST